MCARRRRGRDDDDDGGCCCCSCCCCRPASSAAAGNGDREPLRQCCWKVPFLKPPLLGFLSRAASLFPLCPPFFLIWRCLQFIPWRQLIHPLPFFFFFFLLPIYTQFAQPFFFPEYVANILKKEKKNLTSFCLFWCSWTVIFRSKKKKEKKKFSP